MRHFAGDLILSDGSLNLQQSRLEAAEGEYAVSGTASLGRILNLKLTRAGAPGFSITGPLTEPRVAELTTAETRAALKP
jgi:hypothetical protein